MADQQRWFKLWCSVLTDDELQSLSPADRWAWAALGAHTKQNGTRGVVIISLKNAALAGAMGVTVEDLASVLHRLPHMRVEYQKPDNGRLTVTWQNWTKYQEDSTVAERVRRLRSKKRGEEKREEVPPKPPTKVPHATGSNGHPSDGELAQHEAKKAAALAVLRSAGLRPPADSA